MTMRPWRASLAPSNVSMFISIITRPARKPKLTSLPTLCVSIIGNAAIRLWVISHQTSSSGATTLTCLNSLSTFSAKAHEDSLEIYTTIDFIADEDNNSINHIAFSAEAHKPLAQGGY